MIWPHGFLYSKYAIQPETLVQLFSFQQDSFLHPLLRQNPKASTGEAVMGRALVTHCGRQVTSLHASEQGETACKQPVTLLMDFNGGVGIHDNAPVTVVLDLCEPTYNDHHSFLCSTLLTDSSPRMPHAGSTV